MKREHKDEASHLREDEKSESILILGGTTQSSRIAFITSFKRGERDWRPPQRPIISYLVIHSPVSRLKVSLLG